jgi:integrase
MRSIHRLTQRQCEAALPTETVVHVKGSHSLTDPDKTLERQRQRARPLAMTAGRDGKSVIVKRRTKFLCDGAGLWLVVSPGKDPDLVNRSWIFRWNVGQAVIGKSGKARRLQRVLGLGSLNTVNLERARELADACRRQLQDGKDPLLTKRSRAAAAKIEERRLRPLRAAVDEYLRLHGKGWSMKYAKNWQRSFQHLQKLLDLPVSTIDRAMIVEALHPLWDSRPETGGRVRQRIEQVLWACMSWGWREQGDNPAAWGGHGLKYSFRPKSQLQPVKRRPALPYADVADFMRKLRAIESQDRKVSESDLKNRTRALELLILTAVRTGEVVTATGDEFDLDSDRPTWTVPAHKTKTGKQTNEPHIIPLSPAAVACLRKEELVAGKRVFDFHDRTLWRLCREIRNDVSVHGFRATFSTWAADHGYQREVVEAALDHQVGNDVERAYRRTSWIEQRRILLRDWAEFCEGKAAGDNVVQLRAGEK